MARWDVLMQPAITVSAASQVQDVRFAVPTGNAKTVMALLNILKHGSSTAVTWTLYEATDLLSFSDDVTLTVPFWLTALQTTVSSGIVETTNLGFSNPAPFLRWGVSGITGSVTFSILLCCWDS